MYFSCYYYFFLGSVPISLLFDEHAEELSFPQIYLGQFRHFREGLSVTPFMMATSELRRSDRRGVTPQHLLYMAMKIMRLRIKQSLSIAFKHVGKVLKLLKSKYNQMIIFMAVLRIIWHFFAPSPIQHFIGQKEKEIFLP